MRRFALVVLVIAACRPTPALTPFAAAAPNTQLVHLREDTPIPTQTLRPVFITWTPVVTAILPFATATISPSAAMPTEGSVPTWTPLPTWTVPAPTDNAGVMEHFLFGYPVATSGAHALSRVYPYGSTYNGRLQVHHGVDLVHPMGTPIFAAGDGVVLYAGNDFVVEFGPETNYYGYLVVIQHNFLSAEQLPVYTLYGHMQQVTVQVGQTLSEGDVIGTVGQSGVARGPHVHFEVRVGNPFDFGATRNPELWMRPLPNSGVLVGRLTDANGSPLYGMTINVQSSQMIRSAYSYVDDTVNRDALLDENFTLGDLPPNYYSVSVRVGGVERFAETVYVQPGQMTWVNVVLK